jgi:hypothetical protein
MDENHEKKIMARHLGSNGLTRKELVLYVDAVEVDQ